MQHTNLGSMAWSLHRPLAEHEMLLVRQAAGLHTAGACTWCRSRQQLAVDH